MFLNINLEYILIKVLLIIIMKKQKELVKINIITRIFTTNLINKFEQEGRKNNQKLIPKYVLDYHLKIGNLSYKFNKNFNFIIYKRRNFLIFSKYFCALFFLL